MSVTEFGWPPHQSSRACMWMNSSRDRSTIVNGPDPIGSEFAYCRAAEYGSSAVTGSQMCLGRM